MFQSKIATLTDYELLAFREQAEASLAVAESLIADGVHDTRLGPTQVLEVEFMQKTKIKEINAEIARRETEKAGKQ